ncbi:hypothetical protein [Arenibacter certesii]|uniref:HEAT repeat domain-containing protein n=1 Tax=Arenibacter certesii TaxID=228955 RepID=A0A918J6V5_9FLAO|nr:hypothetical protein [Arenibacter certesii]GGW49149.1 hypothetical protein GCM10007383_36390 [Arenibacter certesii]
MINTLMSKFWKNEITKDEIKKYKSKINSNEIKKSFEKALANKDRKLLEETLFIGFIIDNIDDSKDVLLNLISKEWHAENEDIIRLFQNRFNTSENNIPYLLNAINNVPKYIFENGDNISYIKKIMYAIGAQPEPYNIEALEELAKSDDIQIKDLALHQIKKRKSMGRWEFKKNNESES